MTVLRSINVYKCINYCWHSSERWRKWERKKKSGLNLSSHFDMDHAQRMSPDFLPCERIWVRMSLPIECCGEHVTSMCYPHHIEVYCYGWLDNFASICLACRVQNYNSVIFVRIIWSFLFIFRDANRKLLAIWHECEVRDAKCSCATGILRLL